jgi:hypothetical protein
VELFAELFEDVLDIVLASSERSSRDKFPPASDDGFEPAPSSSAAGPVEHVRI